MSITILQSSRSGVRTFCIKKSYLYWFSFIALSAFWLILAGSYYLGKSHQQNSKFSLTTLQNWQDELERQGQELETAKLSSKQQLEALTAKLAIVQAHVRRLDAAGERIVTIAGLDAKEFNFDQTPAMGGPEKQIAAKPVSPEEVFSSLEEFDEQLESRERQLKIIESLLLNKKLDAQAYISGRPIKKGWMSSLYGERTDPFTGNSAWHAGVDFAGKEDSEVLATAAGIVSWSGDRYGFGLLVEINHGDGLVTRYGHNKKILVKTGEMVKKGQIIARMGNTGRSTGAHVHYEVLKNGRNVDPMPYVNRKHKK